MPLILFNKPFQVLCQFSPQDGRLTLADHLSIPGIYPAGRLDADSEGLLLLTDDGRLQHEISHPDRKEAKTYLVQVDGVPDAASMPLVLKTLSQLRQAGVRVQMHAATEQGMGSMKSQFKKADASGAHFALIFGGDELARGEVTVKSLRDGQGAQVLRSLTDVSTWAPSLQLRA